MPEKKRIVNMREEEDGHLQPKTKLCPTSDKTDK